MYFEQILERYPDEDVPCDWPALDARTSATNQDHSLKDTEHAPGLPYPAQLPLPRAQVRLGQEEERGWREGSCLAWGGEGPHACLQSSPGPPARAALAWMRCAAPSLNPAAGWRCRATELQGNSFCVGEKVSSLGAETGTLSSQSLCSWPGIRCWADICKGTFCYHQAAGLMGGAELQGTYCADRAREVRRDPLAFRWSSRGGMAPGQHCHSSLRRQGGAGTARQR